MRAALIHGVAIVLAGIAVGMGIKGVAEQMQFGRSRYAIAAVGHTIAVLDTHSGQVQTFRRLAGSHTYTYLGTDSRNLHERHQEQWQKLMRHRPKK